MTTVVYGTIAAPTGPDTHDGVYGYDNGGFFSPIGTNLGGLPFTVTWTGTPCNCAGVTDVTLAINGVTLDLMAYGGVSNNEWYDSFAQVQTTYQYEQSPPWSIILPTSQYSLTTYFNGNPWGATGAFYLLDSNHQFETNAFLNVVPGPTVGENIFALITLPLLITYWWWNRRMSKR